MVVGQLEFLSCHPRAWLPREGSRIPGFLARQTKQTRGNDRRVRPKLTHYRADGLDCGLARTDIILPW